MRIKGLCIGNYEELSGAYLIISLISSVVKNIQNYLFQILQILVMDHLLIGNLKSKSIED